MDPPTLTAAYEYAQQLPDTERSSFFLNLFRHCLEVPVEGGVPPMEQFSRSPAEAVAATAPQSEARPPTRRRWTALDGLEAEDVGHQLSPVPHSLIARPPTRRRSLLTKDGDLSSNSSAVPDSNGPSATPQISAAQRFSGVPSIDILAEGSNNSLCRVLSDDAPAPTEVTVVEGPSSFQSSASFPSTDREPAATPTSFPVARAALPAPPRPGPAPPCPLRSAAPDAALSLAPPPPSGHKPLTASELRACETQEEWALFREFEEFREWQRFQQFQQWRAWRASEQLGATLGGWAPPVDDGVHTEAERSGLSQWSVRAVRGESPLPAFEEPLSPLSAMDRPWRVDSVKSTAHLSRPVHTPSTAASRPFSPGGSNPASRPPSRPASRASGLWGEISDLVEENPSQQGFLQALLRDVRLLVRDDHTRTQLARFCARLRSAHGTPCSPEDLSRSNTLQLLTEYVASLLESEGEARDPSAAIPGRVNATPRNTPLPASTPVSLAAPRGELPPSASWGPLTGATPPTTPALPAMMRSYASSEDLLRILSERMFGVVSPITPQTTEDRTTDYNAQLSAHMALLKLTLSDLQRRGVRSASPTQRTPNSESLEILRGTAAATPTATPHPSINLIPARAVGLGGSSTPEAAEGNGLDALQALAVPSQGVTPPPTPATSAPGLGAQAERSAEELKQRLSEGLPGLREDGVDVEAVQLGALQEEAAGAPAVVRRVGPGEQPTLVPKNTPMCQSPATVGQSSLSPQPMSPLNAGKEAFALYGPASMTDALTYKLPAQTPPTTPAIHGRPRGVKALQAETLPHRLAERLQRVEQGNLADLPHVSQSLSRSTSGGRAGIYQEQEELWREYQRSLQHQALILEQERLHHVFEHQKLEQYEAIVAHREQVREQLSQLAAGSLAGDGKGGKFDQPALATVVESLWAFAAPLLPAAATHHEFLTCLQQTVLKYEGYDIAFHKDRLLQDAYDVLCDELLFWQKSGPRSGDPPSAADSPSAGGTAPPLEAPRLGSAGPSE